MQNTICAKTERTVRNVKCRLISSRKSVARPGGGAAFVSHALSCTEVLFSNEGVVQLRTAASDFGQV
jgi:hypothetical protein